MSNKIIWPVLLIVALLVLAFAFWGDSEVVLVPVPVATSTPVSTSTVATTSTTTSSGVNLAEKVFTVTSSGYSFTPNQLAVNQGDRVRIILVNDQGFHDWVIDEFNAKTPQISAGQQAEVSFVADRVGTFEYYCSVGNHRAMGMVGKLIIN